MSIVNFTYCLTNEAFPPPHPDFPFGILMFTASILLLEGLLSFDSLSFSSFNYFIVYSQNQLVYLHCIIDTYRWL